MDGRQKDSKGGEGRGCVLTGVPSPIRGFTGVPHPRAPPTPTPPNLGHKVPPIPAQCSLAPSCQLEKQLLPPLYSHTTTHRHRLALVSCHVDHIALSLHSNETLIMRGRSLASALTRSRPRYAFRDAFCLSTASVANRAFNNLIYVHYCFVSYVR